MTELISKCCGAKVIIDEDWADDREVILWYKCSKCKKCCGAEDVKKEGKGRK